MAKDNMNFAMFNGISDSSAYSTIPIQTLKKSDKNKSWKKATVDALERHGLEQIRKNLVFRDWKAMYEGRFTYLGTGISNFQELPWFDKEVRKLRDDAHIPTYIKHFDFIGIVVNALAGVYDEMDDRYRVESIDEYSTNEYIRQKTEMLHQFAQQVFIEEVNKMLRLRGYDPQKQDFETEEEAQAYQEEIQNQTKALTPPEIEANLSKNFKVVATEWAQNVLTADKKRFYLADKDREDFVNFLLTGRFFRHYRVGYDSYYIEQWSPEETFFSQDVDARYPQDGEYVGRITSMSVSNILNKYGHLMTLKQQESVGNYWNQSKQDWSNNGSHLETKRPVSEVVFPQPTVVPFHNYHDHLINLQLEDALGAPLATKTQIDDEGNEESFSTYIPRQENETDFYSGNFTTYLRDDIDVRRDTVRITEVYWRSYKRIGILIHENDLGSLSVDLVDDDLLSDYLEDEEIKTLKTLSISDLQKALKEERLQEYINTITYTFVPEVWKAVKIKGNGSTMKEDMYLDVKPLDYQIKGENSNIYDVKLPVTGIIDTGIAPKLEPYQQLHNICMNQITELLEKELGVFFTFDITGLPSEYQDETTEESMIRVRNDIKDLGVLGLDLSRQNTQGNNPNLFQRQEVVYATQVQYRWELAKQYKAEGLAQIGITNSILGQPIASETAEGIKQGVQASYALLNHYMDKMNTAKAKSMEVHLAIAQFCEVEGKESTILTRKGDGELSFIDILKEDEELFPLRNLSVHPITGSSDRKMVEQIKQFVVNDNTMQRDFEDVLSIITNPVLVEIQQAAKDIKKKSDKAVQEQRAFESEQLDKQIASQEKKEADKRAHEINLANINNQAKLEEEKINSFGRASLSEDPGANFDRIEKSTQRAIDNAYKEQDVAIKNVEQERKQTSDAESKKIEWAKLAQQTEKLRLEREKLRTQERIATINKN
jgi:hypothetical protein